MLFHRQLCSSNSHWCAFLISHLHAHISFVKNRFSLLQRDHSDLRLSPRPLSKVLPCPNKGSRWWFLNFPQLRDISYSNIFNVHNPGKACTESFFNLNTAHLWPSIFCWKFVFICIVLSYLTVDTAHHTHLYTVVYGSLSGWCWWERSKLARDLGHKAFCLVWLVLNEESWKWFPILFFLFRNAHMLFTFNFCIPLYVY
jgi:hypothetical protein